MNEKLPQFADRHVRRAITYAIDRPALVARGQLRDGGSPGARSSRRASSTTPPARPSWPTACQKAKAELAKSKFPKGFSTKLLIDGGVQKWNTFAQIIKAQLQPLGINVDITPLDHSAFEATFQKLRLRHVHRLRHQRHQRPGRDGLVRGRRQERRVPVVLVELRRPEPLIALVHQAEAEYNSSKRAALYAQIQEIVAEDAPFVALDYPPYIYAVSKQVNGFAVNPGGAYRLENVWLA